MLPWLGPDYDVLREVYSNTFEATCAGEPRWIVLIEDRDLQAPPLVALHEGVITVFESFRRDEHVVLSIERAAGESLWRVGDRARQAIARAKTSPCIECDGEVRLVRCEPGIQALCESCGGMFEWRHLAAGPDPAPGAWLDGPLWIEDAAAIARAVTIALEHLHRHPIARTGLDPRRIAIEIGGAVRLVPPTVIPRRRFHRHLAPAAVARYIAPETARGQQATAASDVYSLAALLYELFTGRHPTATGGNSTLAILRELETRIPTPPSSRVRGFPVELEEAVIDGLHKSPAARPPLSEMRRAIDELISARELDLSPAKLAALASSLVVPSESWLLSLLP